MHISTHPSARSYTTLCLLDEVESLLDLRLQVGQHGVQALLLEGGQGAEGEHLLHAVGTVCMNRD